MYLSPCIDKRLQYLQMIKVVWNVVKKIFGFVMLIFSPLKRLWCRRKRRTSDPILPISNHYPSVENLNVSYSSMNGTGQVLYLLSTQRGFYKEHPAPRFFVSADSHSLRWAVSPLNQLNCSLIWVILKPRGAVAVVHGGTHGGLPLVRVTRYSWFVLLVWKPKL